MAHWWVTVWSSSTISVHTKAYIRGFFIYESAMFTDKNCEKKTLIDNYCALLRKIETALGFVEADPGRLKTSLYSNNSRIRFGVTQQNVELGHFCLSDKDLNDSS